METASSTTERLQSELVAQLGTRGAASAYRLRCWVEAEWKRKVPPPLIYRALDRLCAQGQVTRLSTTRRFALVETGEGARVVLSCRSCGDARLHEDKGAFDALSRLSDRSAFIPDQGPVEIVGLCRGCAPAA